MISRSSEPVLGKGGSGNLGKLDKKVVWSRSAIRGQNFANVDAVARWNLHIYNMACKHFCGFSLNSAVAAASPFHLMSSPCTLQWLTSQGRKSSKSVDWHSRIWLASFLLPFFHFLKQKCENCVFLLAHVLMCLKGNSCQITYSDALHILSGDW